MPEPSGSGGFCVALAGEPLPSVFIAGGAVAVGPAGFASPAGFVANPACFAAHAPHDDVRASVVDGVAEVGDVIVACGVVDGTVLIGAAVVAAGTGGTVEPHFKLVVAIFRNFGTLREKDLLGIVRSVETVGSFCAPVGRVAVPGRDVEAIFHAEVFGSGGEVSGDVGVASELVAGVCDVVCGGGGGPEAEAVMVFHDCDAAAHSCGFDGFEPLTRVRCCGGCEASFSFVAVAPFPPGVGVHAVVEETVELGLVPSNLSCGGNGEDGARFVFRIRKNLVRHR